ncbi:hypothetical protein FACS189430_11690 [Bacteroidia bacterium]|nr:hypothetical protein FACS189430_11690 [Bacteroidia bacterium]
MKKITNVSLIEFKKFLKYVGCELKRTNGGHEVWSNPRGKKKPIVFQSHFKNVNPLIVSNTLRDLDMSKEEFFKILGLI